MKDYASAKLRFSSFGRWQSNHLRWRLKVYSTDLSKSEQHTELQRAFDVSAVRKLVFFL